MLICEPTPGISAEPTYQLVAAFVFMMQDYCFDGWERLMTEQETTARQRKASVSMETKRYFHLRHVQWIYDTPASTWNLNAQAKAKLLAHPFIGHGSFCFMMYSWILFKNKKNKGGGGFKLEENWHDPFPACSTKSHQHPPVVVPVMRLLADRAGWHQLPFILPAGYTTIGISRYTQPSSQPARQPGTSAAAAHGKDTADRRQRRQRHCFHQPSTITSVQGMFSVDVRDVPHWSDHAVLRLLWCVWCRQLSDRFPIFLRSRVGSRASRTQD